MKNHITDEIIVIGYGTTRCVLSTIVDGYHRGYKMVLVTDATGAQATPRSNAESMHEYATEILSAFSHPITTASLAFPLTSN